MIDTGAQKSVVVVGSTNVDLIMQVSQLPAPGETVGDAAFTQALGGKGANQALAATRAGASVSFVSVVGDDDYGRNAREAFAVEGIDVAHMTNSCEPTGTALIFVDRHGENCIGVAPGANAKCDVTKVEQAHELVQTARVILLQLEIPLDSVRAVLNLESRAHTILNAAPMLELTPDDIGKLDTLVVNQTELTQIVGHCVRPRKGKVLNNAEACRSLHTLGVTNVVVTLGKEGVFLSSAGVQKALPGFQVDAVDTTGAGDTFCGALAARLALEASFEDAVTFAQAAAALACTQLGAQSAIPVESAVQAFLLA